MVILQGVMEKFFSSTLVAIITKIVSSIVKELVDKHNLPILSKHEKNDDDDDVMITGDNWFPCVSLRRAAAADEKNDEKNELKIKKKLKIISNDHDSELKIHNDDDNNKCCKKLLKLHGRRPNKVFVI